MLDYLKLKQISTISTFWKFRMKSSITYGYERNLPKIQL